jgi:hypothetical protein
LCLGDKVFEGSQEGEECNRDLDETWGILGDQVINS